MLIFYRFKQFFLLPKKQRIRVMIVLSLNLFVVKNNKDKNKEGQLKRQVVVPLVRLYVPETAGSDFIFNPVTFSTLMFETEES